MLKTLLANLVESLEAYSGRKGRVSAHSTIELAKEAGIPKAMYFLKVLTSQPSIYTGGSQGERAEDEVYQAEIVSFVRTSDSLNAKDNDYNVLLDMSDSVKNWIYNASIADISADLELLKYKGISRVQDDRPGFYALTQRIEFTTSQ